METSIIQPPLPKLLSSSESEKLRLRTIASRKRKSKFNSTKCLPAKRPNTSPPPRRPWIASTTITHLTTIAVAQHLAPPSLSLPEEIQYQLQEEWEHIVHDSFERFRKEMQCSECGHVMEWCGDEGVKWFLDGLRDEMDGWCAWEVDETCTERWDAGFEKMVPLLSGRKMGGCWALEQERQGQDVEDEMENVGVDSVAGVHTDLSVEYEVKVCKIEGLEALRLLGGEGFTVDGFIRLGSPLWGSVVDESMDGSNGGEDIISDGVDQNSVSGESEGSISPTQVITGDVDITTCENVQDIPAYPSSRSLEVKETTAHRDGRPGQFIIDMLDAFSEDSSENESISNINEAEDDFEALVKANSDEASQMDASLDWNSLLEGREELWPSGEMEIDQSTESVASRQKISERDCASGGGDNSENSGDDITDSKGLCATGEQIDIARCNFEDHQRFSLIDAMETDESSDRALGNGQDNEGYLISEESGDYQSEDVEKVCEDVVPESRAGGSKVDNGRVHYFEDSVDVEIRHGYEFPESSDGDADDEESDELFDESDSELDSYTDQDTRNNKPGQVIQGSSEEDVASQSYKGGLEGSPCQVSISAGSDSELEAIDNDPSEYEYDVEQAAPVGYGAQFQGVREYQGDESEESEEE
ncbi:hypothetical protein ONS95_003329 [Cadophora gregata]|uniref:uncharacterized protein n=1 Tax=Cadophora gregata TaxID=51156 RepID=UPI0026DB14E3|nr:uncharacterized protein ONS95_003329 [Cadophora gregata]KAK0108524.1 hypothetical protein ONS95_003329 [Cadophora gregata]KAK0108880.1 hypothetical protein ONS96_002717 [Cadophora gregata f. sp. sojae]